MKKVMYLLAVYPDEKVGYWGSFADFDCCVVQASTLEELSIEAERILDEDVTDMVNNGIVLPPPSDGKQIKEKLDPEDGEPEIFMAIPCYPPAKTERINLTMKGDILARIDDYAHKKNINRSKLMVRATLDYIRNNA